MQNKILTLLAFFVLLSPITVLAHAGHGTFNGINPWHYVTSPMHFFSAMVVLAATVFGVWYFKRVQAK